VIAPTPIKLRIITEAATPAIIGLIRIDAGLKVLAFMIVFGSRAWRRTWAGVCNRRASMGLSNRLNGLFRNRERLQSSICRLPTTVSGTLRKTRLKGKGFCCRPAATTRPNARPGFSPSRA
jgi:hypothetical protein